MSLQHTEIRVTGKGYSDAELAKYIEDQVLPSLRSGETRKCEEGGDPRHSVRFEINRGGWVYLDSSNPY